VSEPVTLPIVPLHTVLFPGMLLPLRIFEPRYLQLVRACTTSRSSFGVALIARGEEVGGPALPHHVGTSARITSVERCQDGTLDVLSVGERRFVIERMVVETATPYAVGEVRWLLDDAQGAVQGDGLIEAVRALAESYTAVLQRLAPGWRAPAIADDLSAIELSYQVGALLQVEYARRQELLEAPTVSARLERERELLTLESRVLQQVLRQRQNAWPSGPYQPSIN